MHDRIRLIARILARINAHRKAGRITEMQRIALFRHVLAEYGRE
jgi:hypothetical protein